GGDFGVGVVRLQTYLTEILSFLEKFEGGFEQDIDNEGERDIEDEDGDGEVSWLFNLNYRKDMIEWESMALDREKM
ncbi:hypothetical protein Tco_1337926, partial [Tanacetum coccineum]